MRKIFLSLLLCMALIPSARAANLYSRFKEKPVIKVYLEEVKSEASNPNVDISVFKDTFRKILVKRVNVNFEPVSGKSGADAVVTADIKKYKFKKSVMPMFFSLWAFIADMTAPKSSATLVVDYRVLTPEDGKLLAEFKDFTTVERRPRKHVAGGKDFFYASAKNINRFLYRAFHKQRKKSRF